MNICKWQFFPDGFVNLPEKKQTGKVSSQPHFYEINLLTIRNKCFLLPENNNQLRLFFLICESFFRSFICSSRHDSFLHFFVKF